MTGGRSDRGRDWMLSHCCGTGGRRLCAEAPNPSPLGRGCHVVAESRGGDFLGYRAATVAAAAAATAPGQLSVPMSRRVAREAAGVGPVDTHCHSGCLVPLPRGRRSWGSPTSPVQARARSLYWAYRVRKGGPSIFRVCSPQVATLTARTANTLSVLTRVPALSTGAGGPAAAGPSAAGARERHRLPRVLGWRASRRRQLARSFPGRGLLPSAPSTPFSPMASCSAWDRHTTAAANRSSTNSTSTAYRAEVAASSFRVRRGR